ncbi:lymphotoxin-beta isoform X1 [Lagenorhynchus albirostris]|uniref:lymphotoxin-beta isoform X1 n=1 Tax=Lagenorhynchus albirostris TaxID=27610 RepID=UPI0028E30048|nr:lymphotoxin-beta isoform X1 [Lagenorhynchus albirostris]
MGALGLECRGRRPQGKGCLLLAVAGAASLVTLLLAVPITVLAVLALVPHEQGGLSPGSCRWRRRQKQISAPGSRLPTSLALGPRGRG